MKYLYKLIYLQHDCYKYFFSEYSNKIFWTLQSEFKMALYLLISMGLTKFVVKKHIIKYNEVI